MSDTVEISRKLLNDLAWAIVDHPPTVVHQGWGMPDKAVCAFCKAEDQHTAECVTRKARNVLSGETK